MKDYFLHSLGHRMTGLVLESHLAIPGCSLQVPQHRHCHLKCNKVQSQLSTDGFHTKSIIEQQSLDDSYQLYDLHSAVVRDRSLWSFFLLVNVDIGHVFRTHPHMMNWRLDK